MSDYLVRAIRALKPNSEFTFTNDDYTTIEWVVLEGKAPSQIDIEAKIAELKLSDEQALSETVIAKAALLKRLGITEEEARLLLA